MMMRKIRSRGDFQMKLCAGVALIVAGDSMIWRLDQDRAGWGALLLMLLPPALALRPALRHDRRALICFALAALMALATLFDPGLLSWTLFWIFAGMGTLMPSVARFGDAWQWSQRLMLHGLRSCAAPWLDGFRVTRLRRRKKVIGLRAVLPQLALPLFGSVIILGLFTAANPVLEQAFNRLFSISLFDFPVERMMVWPLFFTMAWSLLRPRGWRHLLGTFDGRGDLALPGVSVASVRLSLIAFNALFALQNLMDLAWLWGLLPLPSGMTLASYAHRGAYPLIVTALLAAGFVLVALRPGSQTASMPLIRRMVVLWIAQNVLLVGNAALRTLDYIAAFSLTSWRIAALLWMGLVSFGLVLVCWRMLRNKTSAWLINANAAAALALMSACCFVDLGTVSARYNIAHARELGGDGAPLDICYLQQLGPSALVPLAELEARPAPEAIHLWARLLRQNAQFTLSNDQSGGHWTLLGALRLADVRTRLRMAALSPRWTDAPICQTRSVYALRIALKLEQAPQPQTQPQPAPTLTTQARP
ncbi:DUF4153 domain-containing protein [Novosphingobium terrae]|uniref:DUF4153 domain-containing protein n=1 Tax=Novosphingobium terrae TaxID=2726189 RepID=UPI00197D679A|nr:DUF4173 domain-containing protein [Novosphingobium terrae]